GLQQPPCGCTANSQDNVRGEGNRFRDVSANALGVTRTPADVNANIAALGPARLCQRLCKCQNAALLCRIVRREVGQHADAPHALALLRAWRERPGRRRAAEQRDELAAPHSITSSARASSVGGTSRPSALAVLRL